MAHAKARHLPSPERYRVAPTPVIPCGKAFRMKTWRQVILVNLALAAVGLRVWLDPWPAFGEVPLLDLVHAGARTGPSRHKPLPPGCGPHAPGPPQSHPADGLSPRPPSPGRLPQPVRDGSDALLADQHRGRGSARSTRPRVHARKECAEAAVSPTARPPCIFSPAAQSSQPNADHDATHGVPELEIGTRAVLVGIVARHACGRDGLISIHGRQVLDAAERLPAVEGL